MELWYPSIEDFIQCNKYVLETWPVKKKDRHLILGRYKIEKIINGLKRKKGSIQRKASYILISTSKEHPFGAGNRRTAHLMANMFLWKNANYSVLKKEPKITKLFKDIRNEKISEVEVAKYLGEKSC